jgi:hypothetical protein
MATMGVLTSALFTSGDPETNQKLENCATGSPSEVASHFTIGSPGGDHIKRLQTALRTYKNSHGGETFEGKPIGDFPVDGQYSKAFADAVGQYKGIKGIKNYANQIDKIIGIKTIKSLDSEMPQNVIPDFPIPPIDPFQRLVLRLSGECLLVGDRKDDFGADDLKFADAFNSVRRAKMKAACAAMLGIPDSVLETQLRAMMVAAMGATAAQSRETPSPGVLAEGSACVEHFISAGGTNKIFGAAVSEAAKTNEGLSNDLLVNAEIVINHDIRAAWNRGTIDDREIAAKLKGSRKLDDKGIKMSGALTAFIGGVHAYTLKMCKLTVDELSDTFSYAFDVELIDHFGLDEDDVADSTGGALTGSSLMPFFLLQHFSSGGPINNSLHRYRPYRTILRTRIGPKTFKHRL